MSKGVKNNSIIILNKEYKVYLQLACRSGNLVFVKILNYLNPNIKFYNNYDYDDTWYDDGCKCDILTYNVFFDACNYGHIDIIKWLLNFPDKLWICECQIKDIKDIEIIKLIQKQLKKN